MNDPMYEEFDVIVVGSGAGGGVVAGELAQCGRRVLLLEAGRHHTAAGFRRWEAKANRDLYWPMRFAPLPGGDALAFLSGRCVGGSTTINTSVALRAHPRDIAKWHRATGLTNENGDPFSLADLEPWYARVEDVLGVRERSDWEKSVYTAQAGFRALGTDLVPVHSYTDANCMNYGSCLQGCPNDAGKSTMNTYIARALAGCPLELRTGAQVERLVLEDSARGSRAIGVEYVDAGGERHAVHARFIVAAAGALNTAQLLHRSGLANPAIGRHVGLHPVRLVYGLFDEVQDAHRVYPISAHCMKFQTDEDGGFVLEASTVMDPIAFATTIRDEHGPLWGAPLVEALRAYRHWVGVLAMVNDENNAAVSVDRNGCEQITIDFQPGERARIDAALRFSREVLHAAGAKQVLWTGLISTHTQGGCRMGDDPARSVVDRHGQVHGVAGLYVADASLIPRTVSVNPSLTVMALATRLAERLAMELTEEPSPAA
ncbi:MAG: GMC family oxidoreductase [Burkholderiaceae bacterium]|nr:GMC family oxidoreductase [Burkholderiaceae bacterium]